VTLVPETATLETEITLPPALTVKALAAGVDAPSVSLAVSVSVVPLAANTAEDTVGAIRSVLVVHVNCVDATLFRLFEVNLFAPTSTVTLAEVALSVAV
jgi:hypothetical protein